MNEVCFCGCSSSSPFGGHRLVMGATTKAVSCLALRSRISCYSSSSLPILPLPSPIRLYAPLDASYISHCCGLPGLLWCGAGSLLGGVEGDE